MRSTARNFDLIKTKICICLNNSRRAYEFENGAHRTYGLYGISNVNVDGST